MSEERNSQVHPVIRGIINRVSAEVMEADDLLFADMGVVRAALMDVIDAGDPTQTNGSNGSVNSPWPLWHPYQDVANDARTRFCDAVKNRIRELQGPPFNLGVKLENFCDRHRRLKLPYPTAVSCADCEVELNAKLGHGNGE